MTDDLHDALSAWAESDAPLTEPGETRTGAAATRAGRRAILAAGGRPRLGSNTATGQGRSPRRQVRLDADTNTRLDAYAAEHGQTASQVIRDALQAYLPDTPPSEE